jgi:type I restriction enzyme S subunit
MKRQTKERATSLLRQAIDRLRDLRSARITAAVTGQIDVATWGKRGETDRRLEAIEQGVEPERDTAAL